MIRLTILFPLLLNLNMFGQKIGYNYPIKNDEIVLKVILKPRQHVIVNYLTKYYTQEVLNFSNNDSLATIILHSAYADCETMFKLIYVYIGKETVRYEYNFAGLSGDSILIDCQKRVFDISAARLTYGQMNLAVDSLITSSGREKPKLFLKNACDSAFSPDIEYKAHTLLKKTDDSVKLYTTYFTEFKKSAGYVETMQMQNYSIAIKDLLDRIITEHKMDSCYEQAIKRFEEKMQYLLQFEKIIVSSSENYQALSGYITYQILKAKKEYSTGNAFFIIDSLAKGDYNIICKLIFLNNEKNSKIKANLLSKMISEKKGDWVLDSILNRLKSDILTSMPFFGDDILLDGKNNLISLKNITSNPARKLFLLDFWASWCKPCQDEFRYIKPLAINTSIEGLSVIYLSLDTDKTLWKKDDARNQLPRKFSYLINPLNKELLLKKLKIESIPRYILINSRGEMINQDAPPPSNSELLSLIKSYLKK